MSGGLEARFVFHCTLDTPISGALRVLTQLLFRSIPLIRVVQPRDLAPTC